MIRANSRWFCRCHDFISGVQNIDIIICSEAILYIWRKKSINILICSEAIVDGSVGDPDFISGVQNVTVSKGRHVTLSCKVKNLGTHKVIFYFLVDLLYSYIHLLHTPKHQNVK